MDQLNLEEVNQYVNKYIDEFHEAKIKSLKAINLKDIIKKKNPYLFKAKNLNVASELVTNLLEAFLSSSEEKLFGDFLEQFAIFISSKTCNGRKSAATGIDLEFENNNILYLVSIKSGPNWGNSSQHGKQQTDFQKAVQVVKQANKNKNVQPVLGICYGKTRTTYPRNYMKVVGQNFWYLISKNENLYTDIVEPLGYRAKEHNDKFNEEKDAVINRFTEELLKTFCVNGKIDWKKLVEYNSGNLDLKG